ncbi:MAG: nucleotide exchange factor GrpE [Anaerolineaceae bacterium]|nr:nucleotide exchange factor GrpE [Anaerolineaceae bacterium]
MAKQKKSSPKKEEHLQDESMAAEVVVESTELGSEKENVQAQEQAVDDHDELRKAYDDVKKQLDESTDGWQRERADFSNYKKRVDRDRDVQRSIITADLLKKFLVVLDDLERAMKNRPQQGEGAAWAEGIDLVMRKMLGLLEMEDIKRIPAEVELFDPNRHEAVSSEPSEDHESGAIIEILQQGYMIGDRVLRPAVVRVAQ